MKDKGRSRADFRLAVLAFFIFLVLFIYSSLNLKNVDLGYRQHELLMAEKQLRQEIDSLQACRAGLFNLERMERIARDELGYQYPQEGQIIKVIDNGNER
jgi:cell division protein FtsL